ncbi:MAG: phenylalanine--tRNA ligase subunit beta [bacterium]|nr:phenylalanine--tRNA ligase subunit beta [bacterium]
MEIVHEWLQTFFNEPLPEPSELARILTRHAYEVEEIKETPNGAVYVIDILPNRAHDSLSHLGVAKELAVLLDMPVASPLTDYNGPTSDERVSDFVELTIPDDGMVRRASKRIIQNVHITDSPSWLSGRLEAIGQRSINNIVDATNYVTFEMGQPVHAFDYDKLAGDGVKNVTIRYAYDSEKITLLDGNEYELDNSMLVIADDSGALDVAGIKGGARAAIDENTKTVLLSVCNFDPVRTRKTSDKLKIYTDAVKRFNNEPTTEMVATGIERLTQLIVEVAGGEATSDVLDIYPEKPTQETLMVSTRAVNSLLGSHLSDEDIEAVLIRMNHAGFEYKKDGEVFAVTVPFERLDLINPGRGEYSGGNPADLIEEIGRTVGYDAIHDVLPELGFTPVVLKSFYYSERVREILVVLGFSEVDTYSFVSEGTTELHAQVENPISSNLSFMRHRLSFALKTVLDENLRHADLLGLATIKIFEIGNVFTKDSEWLSLALGVKSKSKNDQKADALLLDQALGAIAAGLEVEISDLDVKEHDGAREINFFALLEKLPEPKTYEDLKKCPTNTTKYKPFSAYPIVARDMAVWLPSELPSDTLEQLILLNAGPLLERVDLFDSFSKDNRTSYAYRLIFQALDRTLTDEEVNRVMDILYAKAQENDGWEIR